MNPSKVTTHVIKTAAKRIRMQIDNWDLPDGDIVRLAPNRYPHPKDWGSISMGDLRIVVSDLAGVPTAALAAELISRPDGHSAIARIVALKRSYSKALRPCPKCGQPFGARDLRVHIPKCTTQPPPASTEQAI